MIDFEFLVLLFLPPSAGIPGMYDHAHLQEEWLI